MWSPAQNDGTELACPRCASRSLLLARRFGLLERALGLVGVGPLRCDACGFRFIARQARAGAPIGAQGDCHA